MSKIKDLLLVHGRHTSRKFFKLGNDVFIQADGEDNKLSDHRNKKYGNDVMSFRKVNLNEYESRINNIIEKLKGSVDVEELIRQSLYDTTLKDIETIEKELAKKEPKIKPEKGCVALKIGKNQLVLRQ
jgi:polyhydroxyalkanoate synthesis regulator phasin